MSEFEEHGRRRAQMAFMAMQKWRQQHGVPQLEHLLLAAFASSAEVKGLWAFLVEKNIATEAERQEYLDKGWKLFLDQMDTQPTKLYVPEGGHG